MAQQANNNTEGQLSIGREFTGGEAQTRVESSKFGEKKVESDKAFLVPRQSYEPGEKRELQSATHFGRFATEPYQA